MEELLQALATHRANALNFTSMVHKAGNGSELARDQAKPQEGDDPAGTRTGYSDKASDDDQDPAPDAQKPPGIEPATPVRLVPPVTVLETMALLALLEPSPVLFCFFDHVPCQPARNQLSPAFYHHRCADGLNPGYTTENTQKTCVSSCDRANEPRGACVAAKSNDAKPGPF